MRILLLETFYDKFKSTILSSHQLEIIPIYIANMEVTKNWVEFQLGEISIEEAYKRATSKIEKRVPQPMDRDIILKHPETQTSGLLHYLDIKIRYMEFSKTVDVAFIEDALLTAKTYNEVKVKKVYERFIIGHYPQRMGQDWCHQGHEGKAFLNFRRGAIKLLRDCLKLLQPLPLRSRTTCLS